ncbi:hypothetical protein Clacol_002878 [Clathrus columnatus]|uniref:Oligopeptide transporter n=1 Tax=Clathrus columnatus TaxID=1419009 RepID=A0AAV5A5Z9_9AGAM|nr:hypothetical protein Clacol_002878 [Clathrus columnatus]
MSPLFHQPVFWSSNRMSLQSALIGYLVSLFFRERLTPQENVVLQTTAVATGTMPLAAGFVGIIPALEMLNENQDGVPPLKLSWVHSVGWSLAVAFFGVLLAPPIRKQVIIKEQLAFPSGTATAQLISVLHRKPPPEGVLKNRRGYQSLDSDGLPRNDYQTIPSQDTEVSSLVNDSSGDSSDHTREEVQHSWVALGWSFAASATMTATAYFYPVVFAVPIFGHYLAREWLWSFTPSLSYVGQGIIMGFPTTLSMSLGMVVGWAILAPISKYSGWAPGPVGDMSTGARGWILWISLAIMCADSLTSLLPIIYEFSIKVFNRHKKNHLDLDDDDDDDPETPDRLVPMKWVIWGSGVSIIFGTLLVWWVFGSEGIKPWATVLGYLLGGLLSLLGVRALGETDLNPVSGLGKISQLFFAVIQPGNIVANIIAGGVAEAGAQQAGDLMQDLKTGHLIGASPRAQFYGQLLGSALSVLVTTTAFSLYRRAYPIPGPNFPAPTAYVWLSLARLLRDQQLPERSSLFMTLFAIAAAFNAWIKIRAVERGRWWSKWVPSGIAFAVGFLNTPSFSLARLIGGIIEYIYNRRYRDNGGSTIRLIVIASGRCMSALPVVGVVRKAYAQGADEQCMMYYV